jgi:hypothetical protein
VNSNYVRRCAVALMCSAAVVGAHAGQAQPQQTQPTTQSNTAVSQQQPVTLTGCVYREKDVPGRAPNVAERAGVLEDYILAEVGTTTTAKPGAVGTSGTSGTAKSTGMYKLELIADEKLQTMVGKRVEVTGRVDAEAGDARTTTASPSTTQTDKGIGRDRIDLPEFEVTSIREITGTCPATPTAK